MIVSLKVNPKDVVTYHETGKATDKTEKIEKIKARAGYKTLKADIKANGIKDPIIIRCEKGRVYVEVGEQRVLAAREEGIESIDAIAYSFQGGEIPFDDVKELKSATAINKCFPRKQFMKVFSGVCHECGVDAGETTRKVKVPALQMLRDYILADIAVIVK